MAMGTRSCPAGVESWTRGGGVGEERRVPIVVLQMVWWDFEIVRREYEVCWVVLIKRLVMVSER
jgi:hypothetical protein